jgi:hypothetical protein
VRELAARTVASPAGGAGAPNGTGTPSANG